MRAPENMTPKNGLPPDPLKSSGHGRLFTLILGGLLTSVVLAFGWMVQGRAGASSARQRPNENAQDQGSELHPGSARDVSERAYPTTRYLADRSYPDVPPAAAPAPAEMT